MKLFHFFYDNFPPLLLIAWLFPVSLIFSYLSLYIAGYFKRQLKWRTGLSRKTFHFLIFTFVFIIQLNFALQGTFIVGWAVTAVLVYAIWKGEGHLLYEAIAREQDAPHRSKYIVYSYLATFAGGVLANLFFGRFFAIFGYLITGVGDALAEPVGVLFGKHKYRVFNFNQKVAYRSFEGSAAVFISTVCVLLACNYFMPGVLEISTISLLSCAMICTLVEALSPQGFDNLLLQICGSFAVYILLS